MYSTISLYAVNYNLTSHIAKQWQAYNILNSQNIPHPALVESYKVFYSELKYRIMRGLCYVCYKDLSTYYSDTAPLRSGLTHGKGNNNSIVDFSNIQIAKKKLASTSVRNISDARVWDRWFMTKWNSYDWLLSYLSIPFWAPSSAASINITRTHLKIIWKHILTNRGSVTSYAEIYLIFLNIGSGNDLLHDGTYYL